MIGGGNLESFQTLGKRDSRISRVAQDGRLWLRCLPLDGHAEESSQTERRPLGTLHEVTAHDNNESGHGSTGTVVEKPK